MLMFQVFVNVGMTIGIMPITGVPLPLHELWRLVGDRNIVGMGLLQSITSKRRIAHAAEGPRVTSCATQ